MMKNIEYRLGDILNENIKQQSPSCEKQEGLCCDQSIHFSTMAKRVQNNFLVEYIVTQTIVAMPYAPLALSRFYILEFLDMVLPRAIVGILAENDTQLLKCFHQFGILSKASSSIAQKSG